MRDEKLPRLEPTSPSFRGRHLSCWANIDFIHNLHDGESRLKFGRISFYFMVKRWIGWSHLVQVYYWKKGKNFHLKNQPAINTFLSLLRGCYFLPAFLSKFHVPSLRAVFLRDWIRPSIDYSCCRRQDRLNSLIISSCSFSLFFPTVPFFSRAFGHFSENRAHPVITWKWDP